MAWRESDKMAGSDAEAKFYLGVAAARRGDAKEAETAFHESIKLNPGDPRPILNLALLLESLGRTDEANATFQTARNINPSLVAQYAAAFGAPEQTRGEQVSLWQRMILKNSSSPVASEFDRIIR